MTDHPQHPKHPLLYKPIVDLMLLRRRIPSSPLTRPRRVGQATFDERDEGSNEEEEDETLFE